MGYGATFSICTIQYNTTHTPLACMPKHTHTPPTESSPLAAAQCVRGTVARCVVGPPLSPSASLQAQPAPSPYGPVSPLAPLLLISAGPEAPQRRGDGAGYPGEGRWDGGR